MLNLEFKAKANKRQRVAIDEAICSLCVTSAYGSGKTGKPKRALTSTGTVLF